MSEPIFVAFASQKGGCGKSTLTTLVASYLSYVQGIDVLVIDCDPRQHTQKSYRDSDVMVTRENPNYRKTMEKFYEMYGKPPYEIVCTTPAQAIEAAQEKLSAGNSAKIVFFDITGTINDLHIVITVNHLRIMPRRSRLEDGSVCVTWSIESNSLFIMPVL